jgi:heat shock protein HslJ/LysM repeat protein
MRRLLFTVVVVSMFVMWGPGPGSALAQAGPQCDVDYTVQAGDWLSKVADKYFGDPLAYPLIVEANNASASDTYTDIANPDLIEPGWLLCIPAGTSPQAAPAGLSPEELANTTYQSEFTQDGTAPLVDGTYSEPAAPGSATMTTVTLQPQDTAYGELNGQPSAAVVLVTDPGGSGTFYHLAVVVNQDGAPANVATTLLGDRVEINSVSIENNQIKVDMVQAGPDDPLCCPSQQVVNTYELQGDQLVEVSSEEIAPDGSDQAGTGLAGTSWVLESAGGQPALPDTPATANFGEDGRVNGSTGCNNYGMGYDVDGNTITFSPGPMTLMACPDPVGQQENAYMAALGATATFQIEGDTLQLFDAGGNVVATFSRMEAVELGGTSWNVISYNNGNQAVVSVIIDTEITALFGEDGTLSGSSGCNSYSTSYEVDGDSITISPQIAATMAFCAEPEGIMDQEQQYLAALPTAASYTIELDRMEMRTSEGALVASFERIE